jgi:hypothetical protein
MRVARLEALMRRNFVVEAWTFFVCENKGGVHITSQLK